MLVVSALQNTAYTGNDCLVLMNENKGKCDCRGHAFFVLDQL